MVKSNEIYSKSLNFVKTHAFNKKDLNALFNLIITIHIFIGAYTFLPVYNRTHKGNEPYIIGIVRNVWLMFNVMFDLSLWSANFEVSYNYIKYDKLHDATERFVDKQRKYLLIGNILSSTGIITLTLIKTIHFKEFLDSDRLSLIYSSMLFGMFILYQTFMLLVVLFGCVIIPTVSYPFELCCQMKQKQYTPIPDYELLDA